MRIRLISLSLSLIALAACERAPQAAPKPQALLKGPDSEVSLTIEIADTDVTRAKGLMGRTEIAPDAGMLFVFDEPKAAAFWMKNTLIPLDVIFFDAGMRFVSVSRMTPCVKDPCKTYPSGKPVLYALEVQSGFAVQHGIGTGWTISVPQ